MRTCQVFEELMFQFKGIFRFLTSSLLPGGGVGVWSASQDRKKVSMRLEGSTVLAVINWRLFP